MSLAQQLSFFTAAQPVETIIEKCFFSVYCSTPMVHCLMAYTGNNTTTTRMYQMMTLASSILRTKSLDGHALDN